MASTPPQLPPLQLVHSAQSDSLIENGRHGRASPVSSVDSHASHGHGDVADGIPLQRVSSHSPTEATHEEDYVSLQHRQSHYSTEAPHDGDDISLRHRSTHSYVGTPGGESHSTFQRVRGQRPASEAFAKEGIANAYETYNSTDSEPLFVNGVARRQYNYHDSRKELFRTGFVRLLVTFIFSLLICLTLKAYEGFKTPIILSNHAVRIFNALMLGLSLGLGLNLASSLKKYAVTLRWSLLARRFVSLETFDLILGIETLTKVLRLMIESMPGIRSVPLLREIPWIKNKPRDGPLYTPIFCMLWLLTNIGAQILVAALSLFWPVDPSSAMPLFVHGNVSVSDMTNWNPAAGAQETNQSQLAAANAYGIQAENYPVVSILEDKSSGVASQRNTILEGDGFHKYRFLNRNPDHPYDNVLASGRTIRASASCQQLAVKGNTLYKDDDGQLYANATLENGDWQRIEVPQWVEGGVTWVASHEEYCGPRCTNLTVYQTPNEIEVFSAALFLCNSTLDHVLDGDSDFSHLSDEDWKHINGTDDFARIAAGAIAWTGYTMSGHETFQWQGYLGRGGSKWSPPHPVNRTEIESLLSQFTIGALAALDDHGPAYIVLNQNSRPVQGQQLNVDWGYILGILGSILAIQFGALVLLLAFANKGKILDESFFSIAMLLRPVMDRLGESGRGLSGSEIMAHPIVRNHWIKYGYHDEAEGVDRNELLFASDETSRPRLRAWQPGIYS